jgi:hypothetical protein
VFERFPPPERTQLATLVACAAAGALGLLPGAGGAGDPVTLLGWLTLAAPAAGALCGAGGLALFPFGLAVPGAWVMLLVLALASARVELATPVWAACVLGGLFAAGWALGRRSRAPLRSAGALLLLGLVLTGAALGFGLLAGGAELARTHPGAAARLLDLSPLVLVFDCAGWDWTHAQPEVYARAGVEWFQRRPYRGNLAGPAVLVVGCALAWLARASRPSARPR